MVVSPETCRAARLIPQTALLCGLVLAAPLAASADQTIKIGLILSLSRPGAKMGEHMRRGADFYVKLHKKGLPPGVSVDIVTRDEGSNSAATKRLAQEMIVRDHVQLLTGMTLSPSGFAIAPVATEAKCQSF